MVSYHQHIRVYFGILLALSLRALCESSVSIVSAEPYINQRSCVQQCIYHPGVNDDLAPFIGCNPPFNACYCRADLASSVSYFLTSCVNEGCPSHSADISLAISVYNGYCRSNAPATNAATPTVDGAAPTATVRVVTTVLSSSNAVNGATSQALTTAATPSQPRSGGIVTLYSTETSNVNPSVSSGGRSPRGVGLSDRIVLGVGVAAVVVVGLLSSLNLV